MSFDQKRKVWEILFQNELAPNIHERPSENHHNEKEKGQVLMVSTVKGDEDVTMQSKGELDLNKMAQRVSNLFKFKKFYDQMDFNQEAGHHKGYHWA